MPKPTYLLPLIVLATIAIGFIFHSSITKKAEVLGAATTAYFQNVVVSGTCTGCGGGSGTGSFSRNLTVTDGVTTSSLYANALAIATSSANILGKFYIDSNGAATASSSITSVSSITGLNFVANNFSSGIGYSAVATINGTIGYHYLVSNFGTWQLTSNAASLRELLSDQSYDMYQSGDGFSSVPWSFRIVQDGTHNKILLRLLQGANAGGPGGNSSILNIQAGDSVTDYLDVSASGTLILASSTANVLGKFNADQSGNVYASGTLAIQTNKLVVNSASGKVGIGTTTPIAQLSIGSREELQSGTILNTFATYPGILLNANTGGNQIQLWDNNSNEAKGGLIMTGGSLYAGVWDAGSSGVGTMIFRTANIDRVTLGSTGLLTAAYGITVSDGSLTIASSTSGASSVSSSGRVFLNQLTLETGTQHSLCIIGTGVGAGEVERNAASSCLVSSRRFKHEIQDLQINGLELIKKLRPVEFKRNITNEPSVGFIAEEVQEVEPRLVDLDAQGLPQSVRYQEFTAVLTKAIQELKRWLDSEFTKIWGMLHAQERQIDVQQREINELRDEIQRLKKFKS